MPGTFSPLPWVSDPDMHHGTCVTHVTWCMLGSLTSGFLWSRCRGKRSRHSRRMRNPQFYVSGKRPMLQFVCTQFMSSGNIWCWNTSDIDDTTAQLLFPGTFNQAILIKVCLHLRCPCNMITRKMVNCLTPSKTYTHRICIYTHTKNHLTTHSWVPKWFGLPMTEIIHCSTKTNAGSIWQRYCHKTGRIRLHMYICKRMPMSGLLRDGFCCRNNMLAKQDTGVLLLFCPYSRDAMTRYTFCVYSIRLDEVRLKRVILVSTDDLKSK